ncbi:LCP family protein [Bacillus sp. 31A1R]|uniref:LCP family protein n=1 Tax=Robertmurraya mangrovi TaxID=3098077 RepID=A0ABU5IXT9_9BACI|nr:LCP family protein [Bacillus sp. 31A1R]MDZ5471931.1 LCP family protein [Bacillus sp. 31A1R]
MSTTRRSYNIKKQKSKRKKVFMWIFVPILVLALSATAYGAFLYNKAQSVMDKSYNPIERKSSKRETVVDPQIDNISVLIIGVDESEKRGTDSHGRSDALMLATFNEKAKSVKLVSIPRDSYVYIPEVGYEDKINHAHAFGGPAATIETVEELLDIPVDFYVKVNFNAFMDIVDAVGGVEINVAKAITEQDSQDRQGAINLQPGLQTLNGEQALAYSRTRFDNDIERGKRQQEVLKALITKSVSLGSFTKHADIIEAVGNNMSTDLTFNQMKSFIDYAAAGTSMDIQTLSLEGQDFWTTNSRGNRVYYYQVDQMKLATLQTTLKTHLGVASAEDTNTSTTTAQEGNQSDSY